MGEVFGLDTLSQYSMNNPIWAKDWDGKYFKFVQGKISEQDKSTFNNNLKTAALSKDGAALVKQLSEAPYPIFIESMNNTGNIVGYGGASIDSQGEVIYGTVVIDFNKSANTLKTQLEEMIHVQQNVDASDKKAYQEEVAKEYKTKKYEDRFYEKDAKAKVNNILNEIDVKLEELNNQPKVRHNQLPSKK